MEGILMDGNCDCGVAVKILKAETDASTLYVLSDETSCLSPLVLVEEKILRNPGSKHPVVRLIYSLSTRKK